MSSKQLLKMIKLLASRNPSMKVNWKYHSDDDLIRMKGEEIKTLCPNIQIELSELNQIRIPIKQTSSTCSRSPFQESNVCSSADFIAFSSREDN